MKTKEIATYCRVCEPVCGLVATVEDDRIIKIRNNPDHVHSRGHFCKKAAGVVDVTYDPDRLLYPMKRTGGPGEFTRISWEQAYAEITEKLQAVRERHGPAAFATMSGNPPAFGYSFLIGMNNFHAAMDVKWRYAVYADDISAFLAACDIFFGSASLMPKPDIWATKLLLLVGANPILSKGSAVSEPLFGQALKGIVERGGRVIVVDPRRSETAQHFEHVPIKAGSDPYFFAALVHELLARDLIDHDFVAKHTHNIDQLRAQLAACTPEWAESKCGIAAATIRQLATDIAQASHDGGFALYGRTGTCTQRFGTLTNLLLLLVPLITGNFDRRGGMSFGWGMMHQADALKNSRVGRIRSRATGLPEVGGILPSSALAPDILEPGAEQVRALMTVGTNPAMSSPAAGEKLERALQSLDLFFSVDLYMNETNRFAHYLLPTTTMYERDDFPLLGQALMMRPNLFATEAVVKPRGEVKQEWMIFDDLCRHMGKGGALPTAWMRGLAKLGLRIKPRHLLDMMIRLSPVGDKFGLKPGGLSFAKLIKHPNGVEIHKDLPIGSFTKDLATADKRVDLAPPEIAAELARLAADTHYDNPAYPLRLVNLREVLSHNTWLHNVDSLMTKKRAHAVRLHPDDASARGIAEGDEIVVRSASGEVHSHARLSDALMPGHIAFPHGWGHNGGWRHANAAGGPNVNLLASADIADVEKISGMSVFNGIPVEVRRAAG